MTEYLLKKNHKRYKANNLDDDDSDDNNDSINNKHGNDILIRRSNSFDE